MFRFRRYRVFLLVAVLATATVYHLTHVRDWEVIGVEGLKSFGLLTTSTTTTSSIAPSATSSTSLFIAVTNPTLLQETALASRTTLPSTQPALQNTVQPWSARSSLQKASSTISSIYNGPPLKSRPIVSDEDLLAVRPPATQEFGQHGQGRLEIPLHDAQLEKQFWVPQKEHFPVASTNIINLPTGRPKELMKIQHSFPDESSSARADRQQRLSTIKGAFKHAWSGYTKYAMGHDELSPVTGGIKDPFNGWGATLVDTLDTLWIMGLKEEFEQAVNEVAKIKFTTSLRKDIPIFETVIRYLGGLISAYDLSSGKYAILLDKAVELAEILMGAFDTPNRMPVTFYYWTSSYASQPHRAEARAVLAEIGSLSLEFTRLAQITKEPKYYDAIARITNELEYLQKNTAMPGLWPTIVDASGCKKPERATLQTMTLSSGEVTRVVDEPVMAGSQSLAESARVDEKNDMTDPPPGRLNKRQLDDAALTSADSVAPAPKQNDAQSSPSAIIKDAPISQPPTIQGEGTFEVECETQSLALPPYTKKPIYSIGGQADSTYEYLPKEYMLLGGLSSQYQTMYEDAANMIREQLLFRPMTKDGRDILSVGRVEFNNKATSNPVYEGTHLSCFAGGMFAIGAKVFAIPEDLDIAKRLTDGCVWAYESTTTGIMPEIFELVPCDSLDYCEWNETKYWEALDPDWRKREEREALFAKNRKEFLDRERAKATVTPVQTPKPGQYDTPKLPVDEPVADAVVKSTVAEVNAKLPNRELVASSDEKVQLVDKRFESPITTEANDMMIDVSAIEPLPPLPSPPAVLMHEDFVAARIREERLPPGFKSISSRKYILRPEAIESVFIMYRITGDDYWREKGWKMFSAIQSYTLTEIANSAISDVTSEVPVFDDTMESFWLAETLKYFYLLYSEPSLISLDDYVL